MTTNVIKTSVTLWGTEFTLRATPKAESAKTRIRAVVEVRAKGAKRSFTCYWLPKDEFSVLRAFETLLESALTYSECRGDAKTYLEAMGCEINPKELKEAEDVLRGYRRDYDKVCAWIDEGQNAADTIAAWRQALCDELSEDMDGTQVSMSRP